MWVGIVTIQIVLNCILNNYYFDWNLSKKQCLLQMFVALVCGGVAYTVVGPISGLVFTIAIIITNFLYTRQSLKSIFIPILILITLVTTDYFAEIILAIIYENEKHFINNHIIPILLFCILQVFFTCAILVGGKRFFSFLIQQTNSRENGVFLVTLFLFTVIFYYFNIFITKEENHLDRLNSFFYILYFIVMLFVMKVYISSVLNENRAKAQQEAFNNLKHYSENLEQMYSDMRSFRHDYVNILSSMSEFIRLKDYQHLEKFYHEKILKIRENIQLNNTKLDALCNIKISELKGILASKLLKAQESGIDTTFECFELKSLNIDSLVFVRMIGILLDNAVEECLGMEDAQLNVAFIQLKNTTLFVVQNSCREKPYRVHQLFEKGFSTKGQNRGIGLSNLKAIIDQYDHICLDTRMENGFFTQEIEIHN